MQVRRERSGEPIGAADDLVEALRPHLEQLLAQMLGRRGREQRLGALRDREQLDRLVGEPRGLAQLLQRLLVERAHLVGSQGIGGEVFLFRIAQRIERLDHRVGPQVVGRLVALIVAQRV